MTDRPTHAIHERLRAIRRDIRQAERAGVAAEWDHHTREAFLAALNEQRHLHLDLDEAREIVAAESAAGFYDRPNKH
jgi:hypothetical protein